MVARATSFARASFVMERPHARIQLDAADRHLRRKLLRLETGEEIFVDLTAPVTLDDRDCLVLDDGRLIEIAAVREELLEVTAVDAMRLTQLAWHIGNRHLEAQIDGQRILIRPDRVIAQMLEALGATLRRVHEPFSPVHGAYHAHGSHGH